MNNLEYALLEAAKVQTFTNPIVGGGINAFCGGPVLKDEAQKKLRHTRSRKPVDSFRNHESYEARLLGEYVYAGPIYGHFGHFMAEMVHRIIPARSQNIHSPLVFVTTTNKTPYPTYLHFPGFVKEILDFLNVKFKDVRVISSNSEVEKLHIYQQGSDLGGGATFEYLEMLRDFSINKLSQLHGKTFRPKKLYISRSGLFPAGMILGEKYFEEKLEQEGFTIIRPEEMSFSAQMDYYYKADISIFTEGSACHGTELLGRGMMKNTYLIPRRNTPVVGAFSKLLESRSSSTECLSDCTNYLGSAYARGEDGEALSHKGVSILNVESFIDFFRRNGLANFASFSVNKYISSSLEDLKLYTESAKKDPLYNESLMSDAHRRFENHSINSLRRL